MKDTATNRMYARRIAAGLCVKCKKPNDKTTNRCSVCSELAVKHNSDKRKLRNATGRCTTCGEDEPMGSTRSCRTCKLRHLAQRWLGSRFKWRELEDKLVAQGMKCVYSSRPIDIGTGATVDHIVARSRGGANSIDNLQWVDAKVNDMKSDTDHDEFISLCIDIANTQKAAA